MGKICSCKGKIIMLQIRPFIIENFHPMRPFDSRASCQKCLVGGLHLLALLTWSSSYVAWSRTALVYNWMRLIEGLKLAPRKLLLSVAGVGARVSITNCFVVITVKNKRRSISVIDVRFGHSLTILPCSFFYPPKKENAIKYLLL